ncbi:hypothetical protein RchiOBHm_Chr3g0450401 [Rosa chinensis]|uniref:Uncharacterized protein n=1 Tax=Rosa chinensis TaxID=74649 RepID=A0A2P6R5S1_ROSCH|nr:hypothetical protein RchiOBHm_Chr3g0450401 [Rosa chinensis]
MATCSKIFGAFTCCCCTCQANHDQHISHPQQHSKPSLPTHDHADKAHHDHNQNRIVDNSQGANAKQFTTDKRQHHASQLHGTQGAQKSGLGTDDRFSDYISRAKVKIRTMTMNVGGGNKQNASNSKEDDQHEDHTKDAFSDYIKRVKIKIRQTTRSASRKNFKESKQEKPGS